MPIQCACTLRINSREGGMMRNLTGNLKRMMEGKPGEVVRGLQRGSPCLAMRAAIRSLKLTFPSPDVQPV
jgi:hypothetical protein